MKTNRVLTYFTLGVVAVSCYLTRVAVCWEDRPDVGMIDHFFDMHLDKDRLVEDAMQEHENAQQRQRDYDNFTNEVRSFGTMDQEYDSK